MRLTTCCIVLMFVVATATGCNDEAGNVVPDQKSAFANYLESRELEYSIRSGVYRYIANADRSGYERAPMIENGDSVEFLFEAHLFSTSPGALFFTNRREVIDTLVKTEGLDPEFWPYGPQKIRLGKTALMEGLKNGLPGCREGDSVQLFIPSDQAFSDQSVGIVPPNSATLYILNIEKVKKQ